MGDVTPRTANYSGVMLNAPTIASAVLTNSTETYTVADALTAKAGGGRTGATALTAMLNRVTTVATAADSVLLPVAVAGLEIVAINAAGANAMQVFALGSDTIDGTAGSTGYSQAAGKTVTYVCTVAGAWHKQISA